MDKDRIIQARNSDITSYLASKGLKPKSKGSYWMYISPLPNRPSRDTTASLAVSRKLNKWKDFGNDDNKWRDVIDLVREIEGCEFGRALDILLGEQKSNVRIFTKDTAPDKENILIVERSEVKDDDLIRYIEKRCVDVEIAKKYCKQIHVQFPNSKNGKTYRLIGFKNNLGGYELRNGFFKISTRPKWFTLIGDYGDRYVFEGFFDFLSYLTINKTNTPFGVAIILNTLTMFPNVYKYLSTEGKNNLYLDNDEAADRAIKKLDDVGIKYIDHRNKYAQHNDINEYLKS